MRKISMFLLAVVAMAQTRLQTPARISDSATLPATLNTKVTEWRDLNNSGLFWDARAEVSSVSPGTRLWYLRDNAGSKVLELRRTFAGGVVDLAILDMHFEPTADNVRRIGGPLKRWASVEAGDVMLQNLKPPTVGSGSITFTGNLLPSGTLAIGSTGQRLNKLWVVDLDISGTCTGCPSGGGGFWSRNSGSGFIYPSTVTDDVMVRKLILDDIGGSGVAWDFQNSSTLVSPGARSVYLRDPAGTKVVEFIRTFAGGVVNRAELDMHWTPAIDATYDIGISGKRWRDGRFSRDLYIDNSLAVAGNASVSGTTTVQNLTVNGTCIGCPNYWQLTGFSPVTLSPLSTAYNLAVGSNSANTHKLEVTGSGLFTGNLNVGFGARLLWTSDGNGDIGFSNNNRPANIYAATGVFVQPSGFPLPSSLSSGGLIIVNSGGTEQFRMNASGSFVVNGLTGQSFTSPGGCVFTRGVLTTTCSTW